MYNNKIRRFAKFKFYIKLYIRVLGYDRIKIIYICDSVPDWVSEIVTEWVSDYIVDRYCEFK